jgi:hypothetical protein
LWKQFINGWQDLVVGRRLIQEDSLTVVIEERVIGGTGKCVDCLIEHRAGEGIVQGTRSSRIIEGRLGLDAQVPKADQGKK